MKAHWWLMALGGAVLGLWFALSGPRIEPVPPLRVPSAAPAPQPPDVLTLAVEDDAGPWSEPDGTGYANEVVRAAFRAAGVDVELQIVPYARCRQMVVDGEVAGCFSMSQHADLEGKVVFPTQPLFVCHADYVVRSSEPATVRSLDEIPAGTIVGVVIGYEYPEALERLARAGTIVLAPSRSEELNLLKLAEARIGAAVVNDNELKSFAYMVAHAGVTGQVRQAFKLGDLASFIGFSRRHVRGQAALQAFERGFATLTSTGTLAAIENAWAERVRARASSLAGDALDTPPAP